MRENDILTPNQVGQYLKNMMDRDRLLSQLLVRGELSNYKRYPSGHHYFTLKDGDGALRCVMFRGDAQFLRFPGTDSISSTVPVSPPRGPAIWLWPLSS